MSRKKIQTRGEAPGPGQVKVNSAAYGVHTRAARGTYKKATLNETMQSSSNDLVRANKTAKLIFDSLRPFFGSFERGQCWQRLLSLVRKQHGENGSFDISSLKQFDINAKRPFNRIAAIELHTSVSSDASGESRLDVLPEVKGIYLKRYGPDDTFRLSVLAVFPDFEACHYRSDVIVLPFTSLEAPEIYTLRFDIPPGAASYLLCLKIEGGRGQRVLDGMPSKSMSIHETGIFSYSKKLSSSH